MARLKASWLRAFGALGVAAATAGAAPAMAAPPDHLFLRAFAEPPFIRAIGPADHGVFLLASDETRVYRRWIGVSCMAVDEALQSHLKLDDGVGLVIDEVAPDSPADKAGLRINDVITLVEGKKIGDREALVEAVEEAGDKQLELTVIREGKEIAIAVTSEERPATDAAVRIAPPHMERAMEWLRRVQPHEGAGMLGEPFGVRVWHPGLLMPRRTKLPEGMKITITAEGDQPAEVTVEFEGQTHKTTHDKLDKLPEKVRPHVEGLLGSLPPGMAVLRAQVQAEEGIEGAGERIEKQRMQMNRGGDSKQTMRRFEFGPPSNSGDASIEERIERRFDEMNKKLEALEKALNDRGADADRNTDNDADANGI